MAKTENERPETVIKVKGRKKQKKILRTLIILISVGLLAFTAFYVAPHVRQRTEKAKSDEGENLLFSTDSEVVGGIHLSSGNIVVTAKSLISFKPNGEKRYSENIGYSNPVFKSSDKKYIVFERSTGKYTIADKSGIIFQNDLEEEIINCDIASNGNYAVITRDAGATQKATVYSANNKAVFGWECTDDYLTDAALSKNGKSVAVSSMNVSQGEPLSRIYYFNVDSLQVESKAEYPNETIYRIKFIDNKKLGAITDVGYITVDMNKGESRSVSYEYDKIAGFSFGSGSSVAILKTGFGSLNEKKLMIVNKKCENVFENSIESDILDFGTDGRNAYVLIAGKVLVYSISSGERGDDIDVDASATKIIISGSDIFALSSDCVYKYSSK